MTKNKIILSAVGFVITAFAARVYWEVPIVALMEQFPDIDPKIVRKVHNEMFMETLTGKNGEGRTDDAELDRIFLEKVQKLVSQ
jgi:hypothetical protein